MSRKYCLSDKNYITLLICITVIFLFADQNLMAPNLTAIAKDFDLDDQQRDEKLGGDIAFGFFVLGAPAAIIVGYLADTTNRCRLLGIVVIFGESACLGTYWVKTYIQLFFCRVLTGISIGGATPIIYSLLGDYYPEESRIYVSTLVGISVSFGIAAGQMLAGLVGSIFGWRLPFLLIAIPSLMLGILILGTGKEPRRGSQERAVRIVSSITLDQDDIKTEPFYYQNDDLNSINRLNSTNPMNEVFPCYNIPTKSACLNSEFVNPMHSPRQTTCLLSSIETNYRDRCRLSNDTPTSHTAQNDSNIDNGNNDNNSHNHDHQSSAVDYSEKIDCSKVIIVFQTPSAVLIFLQGIPGCIPWGVIYVFLNDYFAYNRGLSVQQSTMGIFAFGIGGLFGQLFGGWLGQYLYLRDKRLQIILMGSSAILSAFPMFYLLNGAIQANAMFYFMASLSGLISSIAGPNCRTVLQNVCLPEVRGTAFAVFTLTDDIGKGAGPVIIVLLLTACHGNRRLTYNIAILFWLLCGFIQLLIVFFIIKDENKVQERIMTSIQAQRYHNEFVTNNQFSKNVSISTKEKEKIRNEEINPIHDFLRVPLNREYENYYSRKSIGFDYCNHDMKNSNIKINRDGGDDDDDDDEIPKLSIICPSMDIIQSEVTCNIIPYEYTDIVDIPTGYDAV